jgi:hypothetical protein
MVAGPELFRVLSHFEDETFGKTDTNIHHHDHTRSAQNASKKNAKALVLEFAEVGSPFDEDSGDLIALDSQDVMPPAVVKTIYNITEIGKAQFEKFVQERVCCPSKSVNEPLKRNAPSTFGNRGVKKSMKTNITALKNDISLFSRLYISCQSRNEDLDNFFRHENQPWPPSLFRLGELRSGNKADLVTCLLTTTIAEPLTFPDGQLTDTTDALHEVKVQILSSIRTLTGRPLIVIWRSSLGKGLHGATDTAHRKEGVPTQSAVNTVVGA